jgi:predicted Zn-dependent protease
MQVEELKARYGVISGGAIDGYIHYLEGRLINGFYADRQAGQRFQFVLLDEVAPLAYSPGGGYVVISSGLVLCLQSEAELAFALAHELAHQYLGHTRQAVENYTATFSRQRELELQADRYALGVVAIAGYDPRPAVTALVNAYRTGSVESTGMNYPDLQERIRTIRSQVEGSGWHPPGTLNTREFRRFQFNLRRVSPQALPTRSN